MVLFEHIITLPDMSEFIGGLSINVDALSGFFSQLINGEKNLKLMSIILIMLALLLFLFMVIVLYVKSIISFLKSSEKNSRLQNNVIVEEEDDISGNEHVNLRETQIEEELEKELDAAKISKAQYEQRESLRRQQLEEYEKIEDEKASKSNLAIELDWQKGKLKNLSSNAESINLQYHQNHRNLPELVGLIVDMIARSVDELKIAQTIMFRNQNKSSEDEILQLIEAIKDFIAMCVAQKFEIAKKEKELPDETQALVHLANGDASLSLALIEALMELNVEKSLHMSMDKKRNMLLSEISNYAVTFGSLAAMSDLYLATGALELAVELNPQNVNAWNRVADMYRMTDANKKAVWAYEKLLKTADEELDARAIANANKMLSQYYYNEGNSLQAAKLHNLSKEYYDSIGINNRLDRKEIEIIEIIEASKNADIHATIEKLFQNQRA